MYISKLILDENFVDAKSSISAKLMEAASGILDSKKMQIVSEVYGSSEEPDWRKFLESKKKDSISEGKLLDFIKPKGNIHDIALRKGWLVTEPDGKLTHYEKPGHYLSLKKTDDKDGGYWNHLKETDQKDPKGKTLLKFVASGAGSKSLKNHLEEFHGPARSMKESILFEKSKDEKGKNKLKPPQELHSILNKHGYEHIFSENIPDENVPGADWPIIAHNYEHPTRSDIHILEIFSRDGKKEGNQWGSEDDSGHTPESLDRHLKTHKLLKEDTHIRPKFHDLAKEFGYKQKCPEQEHMGITEYQFEHPGGAHFKVKLHNDSGVFQFTHGIGTTAANSYGAADTQGGSGAVQLKNRLMSFHNVDKESPEQLHIQGKCDGFPQCEYCDDPEESTHSFLKYFNGK